MFSTYVYYVERNYSYGLPSGFHILDKIGIVGWGASGETEIQKFLLLQKIAIITINNLPFQDHCKPFFIENKIRTIISPYIYETITPVVQQPIPLRNEQHIIIMFGIRIQKIFISYKTIHSYKKL